MGVPSSRDCPRHNTTPCGFLPLALPLPCLTRTVTSAGPVVLTVTFVSRTLDMFHAPMKRWDHAAGLFAAVAAAFISHPQRVGKHDVPGSNRLGPHPGHVAWASGRNALSKLRNEGRVT